MLKKFLVLSVIVAACYACNNNESKPTPTTATDTTADKPTNAAAAGIDLSKNPDYQKGLALIGANDCLTCHKIDETLTGPPYRDVANKYPNNETTLDSLSNKIIKGGSGNWGSIPMTAHPTLSKDDAKQMVKYIMLLKNK